MERTEKNAREVQVGKTLTCFDQLRLGLLMSPDEFYRAFGVT